MQPRPAPLQGTARGLQLLEAGGAQPAVRGAHRVFASRSSFLDAGARAVEAAHLAAEQPEASGA